MTQMKNAVVAVLWSSRMAAQARICGQRAPAAGLQASEHRRRGRLGQRDAETGRADDGHRLEHRGDARAKAEPSPTPLRDPSDGDPPARAIQKPPAGAAPSRQKGDDRHMSRSGGNRLRGRRHGSDRAGGCRARAHPFI